MKTPMKPNATMPPSTPRKTRMNGRRLPLQERIDGLKDKLLPSTYSAARAARLLGDAGAHEEAEDRLGDIDQETVMSTIAVVRQFLTNLYELPEEIKKLGVKMQSEKSEGDGR